MAADPIDPTAGAPLIEPVLVRQAVVADLDRLAPLFDRYRQFQGQAGDVPAARAFLRARFDHGESIVFLAHGGDRALGFAQLYPSFSSVSLARVFLLNDLFVDEAGRRRGIATRLLAAVEACARALDGKRVTLFVARPNTSAQALYESRGWTRDEQFFVYHRYP
jgi:ribosomal protein S18 acetylase RimI-like enzyme